MVDPTHGRLLQDRDLALLARAAGLAVDGEEGVRALRSDPQRIESLLRHPGLIEILFGAEGGDPLLRASPFLVFAALVHRVARDLETATFVDEWQGPNQTLPVFDVARLRAFPRPAPH